MPKFITVPYLSNTASGNTLKIYSTSGAAVGTIMLERAGVNAVVPYLYSNPGGSVAYLFVSHDEFNTADQSTSHIDIYDISAIATPVLHASLALSNAICGMAIQPGTRDLYVATFSNDITNGSGSTTNPGGIFAFTSASGYATSKYGTQADGNPASFVDYNSTWNAVADVCANIAFDPHGNLWMTTYTAGSSSPTDHFLICFTQVDGNPASSQYFFKLTNGARLPVLQLPGSQSTVSGPLYPLSEPHGIAFDPLGNLWMANNSDDSSVNGLNAAGAREGSLLRLDRSWIDANLLTNAEALGNLTANGYGGGIPIPVDSAITLYSFADGRFGGLSFDGFNLYASDQSPTGDAFHNVIWTLNTLGLAANTTPSSAQFLSSGLTTSYPGNTTIAIFNTTPAKLFISHIAGDTGAALPDAPATLLESPDINMVNNGPLDPTPVPPPAPNASIATGNAFTLPGDDSISANQALIYVRVTNIGTPEMDPSTTGTEVLKLYFGKASAGLDWPSPWDGLAFDPGSPANPAPAGTVLPLGGLIGAVPIGTIDPGNETIFTIPWEGVPLAQYYTTPDGNFCLLARVERYSLYPFGMDTPEEAGSFTAEGQASLNFNVQNNLPIACRNISIAPAAAAAPVVTAISPTSGDAGGGTSVTVTGSGFTGATSVGFGGTSTTALTVVSDTQITATSPAGGGTVDVTVVTPAGTSATSAADQFTYNAAGQSTTITVDTTNTVRNVGAFVLGVNLSGWDTYLSADTASGGGTIPNDQTVSMIRNAGLGLVRLSNGSGADEWHFSCDQNQFPAGAGLLGNIAAALQDQGLVTVNFGTGTVEEAAAYVAYLNGTADTNVAIGVDKNGKDWGTAVSWVSLRGQAPLGGDPLDSLRASHPGPFGLSRFEVGNEVYFHDWSGAPSTVAPADYVTFANAFAAKARMIDPTVQIGLGLGNPIEFDSMWNLPVLLQCREQGFVPDFISDHFYVYDGDYETLSDQGLLENTVADPGSTMPIHADAPRNWAGRANAYRTMLSNTLGDAAASVELLCAEFNSDSDSANKQSTNLVRGLLLADASGAILQTEYNVLVFWDLRNAYTNKPDNPEFYGWRPGTDDGLIGTVDGIAPFSGPFVAYPAYFGAQLASKLVQGGNAVVAAASDHLDLAAYASVLTGGQLALMVINKSADTAFDATISLSGFTPLSAATSWSYGPAEDQQQSASQDGAASLTTNAIVLTVLPTPSGAQVTQSFAPYSMTVLNLSPA